uniref:BRO-B n=1 Tax=Chrysodeixis chalcites nucleopolyhedrovirus TaxID=320432 RepID=T1QZL3_9ABAC|nr:BRO-B [Chrysodeixis chalcites nucleopolyhedrovirus]AGE61778.1 BRO-B [Chrysodeixis chalcites nucleopolyhedrovirus]
MTTSKIMTSFGNENLEVVCVVDESGERWMLANPFAKILEYSNAPNAIAKYVSDKNQLCIEDCRSSHIGQITSLLHPKTKFINKAGLFELIQNSKMPKAQEFKQWINFDLLPKLCDKGRYDMQVDVLANNCAQKNYDGISLSKVQFGDKEVETYTVDVDGEKWMAANPFAEALKYSKPNKAILEKVSTENQKIYEEINSYRIGTGDDSSVLPRNIKSNTKFINRAGVFELINASEMPAAKRFKAWNTNDLLPTLCQQGEYSMTADAPVEIQAGMDIIHQVTNEGKSAIWAKEKQLMELKMEVMEKNLIIAEKNTVIAEKDLTIADKNNTICEMKINYERQISEYKEQALKMQLDLNKMSHMAQMNMMQLGVTTLLAQDNIKENEQMRNNLESVSERVVPSLSNRPEKEEYVTGYERTVDGKKRIRMSRCQRNEIDQCDKFLERQRSNPSKRQRSKRYEWLLDSEKFLQIKCANPVAVWVVIRSKYPHMFYGLKYVNKLCTEMEILNEDELRQKYLADVEMVKKNRLVDRTAIEHFKSLGLMSEEDAILKCLTPSIEAKERVSQIVRAVIDEIKNETKPEGSPKTYENALEIYSPQQVHDQCIKNYFNGNNYIFNGSMPAQDVSSIMQAIDNKSSNE